MKNRTVVLSALLSAAVAAIATWLLVFRSAPHVRGPLRHEVYVWQRAWTEPVRSSVAQHATNFASLVVLKAEVSWKDRQPQVARASPDYAALAAVPTGNNSSNGRAGLPVGQDARQLVPTIGLALRIGPYAGQFTTNDASTAFLCNLAASLVAEARTNHVTLSELQIDFDCAESKLDSYRVWVEAIQHRIAPLPVTVTAVPSWLDAPAFKRLAVSASNYVLQVHSLPRPADIKVIPRLCDPRAAQRAVERAGRLGVPFRVALPTYGYALAFDRDGKFIGLSAEGPRKAWPEGTQLREVNSNPAELAALIRKWTSGRPAAMRGVIWYRLPVATDSLNWRWPTLAAVLAARSPRESCRVERHRTEPGLIELSLVNDGELDINSRFAVRVRWMEARLVAGQGLRDLELVEQTASGARFQTKSQSSRLPAGETRTLGWLRFDRDCEVQCELETR